MGGGGWQVDDGVRIPSATSAPVTREANPKKKKRKNKKKNSFLYLVRYYYLKSRQSCRDCTHTHVKRCAYRIRKTRSRGKEKKNRISVE